MIFIKNKLYIALLLSFALPLGGIGFSTIQNIVSNNIIETNENLELEFKSKGLENGLNLFIYFDALPKDLAIEYNREIKWQSGDIKLALEDAEMESLPSEINEKFLAIRKSDYLTIRKDLAGFAIPILAKAKFYIGGGINQHQTVNPSIQLLKTLYNVAEENDVDMYMAANQNWNNSSLLELLNEQSIKSNGFHMQTGFQGKVLMSNVFINARYTFILKDERSSIKSFPSLTVGVAYGF